MEDVVIAISFYEINPLVVQIANQEFSFLRDSEAKIDIVLGDGRLSLEQEPPQGFDVLVVDAFSGDSIPVHLLTREAFELYFRHLQPARRAGGAHFQPVFEPRARGGGRRNWAGQRSGDGRITRPTARAGSLGRHGFWWGTLKALLGKPEIEKAGTILAATSPQLQWTDDYSSLFKILM